MKIKERPEFNSKPKPVCLAKTDTAKKAITLMAERAIGSIVITNKAGDIEGIVTERDMLKRVLYMNLDPAKTKLDQIMTKEVRVANEDDNLLDWLRIMSNDRFRHLPIVNDNNELVSMMSQGDFVSYTWPELFSRVKENVKATIGVSYEVVLIIVAILVYALVVSLI